jgi:hypothetical protein
MVFLRKDGESKQVCLVKITYLLRESLESVELNKHLLNSDEAVFLSAAKT